MSINKKILIVEDNAVLQFIYEHYIKWVGLECDFACDGKTALKLFQENEYRLVIMDIGLPDKDGCRVAFSMRCEERARFPETWREKRTPIVCISAHSGDDWIRKAILVGMDRIYTKPIDLDIFIKILIDAGIYDIWDTTDKVSSSGFIQPEYAVIPAR